MLSLRGKGFEVVNVNFYSLLSSFGFRFVNDMGSDFGNYVRTLVSRR